MAAKGTRVWHREDIKAELRKRFGPLKNLSIAWDLHPGTISQVLARPGVSIPVERRIAKSLGLKPSTIWPDRWFPNGNPKPAATISAQPRRCAAVPSSQKPGAA